MEFSNTDHVPASGEYRCTSCGEVQEFEADDDFSLCEACGDEGAGWEGLAEGTAEEGLEGGDEYADIV